MTVDEYNREASRLRPILVATAHRYLNDADGAEDIAQDVLLRLWQMCPQLKIPIDALAQVLVRNLCIDHLRRQKPREGIEALPPDATTHSETAEHERIERMMQIVESLPDVQQTILRLRHMEGMEMKDIARLMQMEEPAVRKALSRARQAVRNHFLYER